MAESRTRDFGASEITALTKGLASANEDSFRQFHHLYFDRLYQFLLVVARGQEHEAREALQETLVRVLKYAKVFDSEEVFWSWLKAVARSAARDAGRKEQRYAKLLQHFGSREPPATNPQGLESEPELEYVLHESLGELDSEDRRLIEAKYIAGNTIKELSLESGLTEKAVESRLLRLRRHLRERLLSKLRSI